MGKGGGQITERYIASLCVHNKGEGWPVLASLVHMYQLNDPLQPTKTKTEKLPFQLQAEFFRSKYASTKSLHSNSLRIGHQSG